MPTDKSGGLKRQLTGIDVFCISTGAMISSGLFVLPAIIYATVGPAVILAYIIAGIFILPTLYVKAELTTAMPKAGGDYFFIERSMGSAAGTIGGFASWFSLSLKSAFALIGIGAFASLINPNITPWEIKIIAVGCCVFFTVLNVLSAKLTGGVQRLLVFFLLLLLGIYIFRGAMYVDVHKYTPFMPFGKQSLFAACGMVFVSFGGLTKAASVAEEVENPVRNIPLGMISAFWTILLLYGLTIFVTVGVLTKPELISSLTPISVAGNKIFGKVGAITMAVAAILAFVSTANAGIMAASRFPMAMSRDHLLPDCFASVNKRFNTPHISIIFTGLFMITTMLFLDLEGLVKVASTMKIILFMLVLLAGIVMRESGIMNYKPAFVAPLYPWLHIIGFISYCFFLYQMGSVALVATGIFFIVSLAWHRVYVSGRSKRKAALIHVVERITAKDFAGDSLTEELREILKDRDAIIEDRFDKLVKECEVLDLDEEIAPEDFFNLVAKKLAAHIDIDAEHLFDAFIQREKESTTEIRPGLAIPHIIIEGKGKFELLIARCSSGINLTEVSSPVYAMFILVGTRDERNFHLRALSAIAQTVQDSNFDKHWLKAKNADQLKDILLLTNRHREKD